MRLPERHGSALIIGLLAGALTCGAVATAQALPASLGHVAATSFVDPKGDAQDGPDVTAVAVAGAPVGWIVEVTVTVVGWQAPADRGLDLENETWVWLDTDREAATGDPADGTEYALAAWNDSTGSWWTVERWTGTAWEPAKRSPAMSFVRRGDDLSWTVSTSDLGGTGAFALYVETGTWKWAAAEWATEDRAPDAGRWECSLTGTAGVAAGSNGSGVTLVISPPKTTPERALAGRRFTVSFRANFETATPVVWVDVLSGDTTSFVTRTWTPVSTGKMVCDPSVAGTVIRHAESFARGRPQLSLVVPRGARSQLLRIVMRISATEKSTGTLATGRRIVTFRIR